MSRSKHLARARKWDAVLRLNNQKPVGAEKHRRVLIHELDDVTSSRDAWERAHGELVQLAHAEYVRAERAEKIIGMVRAYVDDPGNWSALDGRRRLLIAMLNGDVE